MPRQLLFIRSKIQFFESKSQHKISTGIESESCLSDQRYNFLKANHNWLVEMPCSWEVVYQIKDTIFWKQITTFRICEKIIISCLSDQRYNFLKANHNISPHENKTKQLFIRSKIQFFESKSQLKMQSWTTSQCCLSDQRYNFLKANHNMYLIPKICQLVVYQIKDTIFWKQITTRWKLNRLRYRCLSDQRYNFLKANHNQFTTPETGNYVVYQIKDTIFWKQITTA